MSYPGVGVRAHAVCEICRGQARGWAIATGQSLDRCETCGHLGRDLERAPAAHRSLAYGGEPTLDRIRLDLTYRALSSGGLPRSALEVGYGAGSMLRRFLDAGVAVAGVDPDQLGIGVDAEVRRRGRLYHGGVEELAPTIRAEAPADGYDLVYGIHVLEHVVDPARTFDAVRDVLRPGGSVQLITPAGDSRGLTLYGSHWWMLEDPTHVRFFTADSLERAARQAGFVDVEVRRPLLDSLSVDVASAARAAGLGAPAGVLGSRWVVGAAAASVPAVVAARIARPLLRPTLHLIARAPR